MSLSRANMDIIKAPTIKLVGAYLFKGLDKRLGLLRNQPLLRG